MPRDKSLSSLETLFMVRLRGFVRHIINLFKELSSWLKGTLSHHLQFFWRFKENFILFFCFINFLSSTPNAWVWKWGWIILDKDYFVLFNNQVSHWSRSWEDEFYSHNSSFSGSALDLIFAWSHFLILCLYFSHRKGLRTLKVIKNIKV